MINRSTTLMQNLADSRNTIALMDLISEETTDVNEQNPDGWTPLLIALASEHEPRLIDLLIKRGANVNVHANDLNTPLIYALNFKYPLSTIELITERDQNINHQSMNGNTALMAALMENMDHDVIIHLLEMGASLVTVNRLGWTPVHIAINQKYHPLLINALSENIGDYINAQSHVGATALLTALSRNYPNETVELLISRNANVNIKAKDDSTPLMFAMDNEYDNDMIRLLLNEGANVNQVSDKGWSPLMLAFLYGYDNDIMIVINLQVLFFKEFSAFFTHNTQHTRKNTFN